MWFHFEWFTDCHYTCHYRCQPFIQLDCTLTSDLTCDQSNYCEDSIETDTNVVRKLSVFVCVMSHIFSNCVFDVCAYIKVESQFVFRPVVCRWR